MPNREHILSLTKKDFVVDTLRGSGPGGQKRNKTESAVRIKHPASGAEAYCCDERSQHSNKAKAFRHLVDSKVFRNWLKIEIARVTGVIDQVTKEVEASLADPKNVRVEGLDDSGKWVELVQ